ncbi:P2Y purinoceptor 1-like [Sparus aurata]|uniref:P2Y purinoceptor 1-like n=1 Tax=Sparus aurata TaxID=8175 RepID=UPI0011C12F08|nr:P2Y purinoceptor 1-like [Sparus aurata]
MHCPSQRLADIRFVTDIFTLVTGVAANTALLWLFLRERKTLSASQVLGLNLVVMDLVYLCIMPVSLIYESAELGQVNLSDSSAIVWQDSNTPHQLDVARDVFSMFNLIGCPMLLACMCTERYLAVVRPVLYLKLRKWEYRMAVSTVVWCATLTFCLATGLVNNITFIMIPVSIIDSCLFFLMLACLGGVVWSLWQPSPAHTTIGNQACSQSPFKRRAVGNVLVVVVPAVISYLPVVAMVPLIVYLIYWDIVLEEALCYVFESASMFPRLGLLIGPLFYLSKARQMC